LARLFPEHSRNRLQGWVRDGVILLNQERVDPKRKVWGGEQLEVHGFPAVEGDMPQQPEDIPLDVVFEDDALLVINKPVGLVVHPGNGNPAGTLLNALLHHDASLAEVPRAGIVHRLDKDTSGLLVVAKTLVAQTDLVRQLQARTVSRRYLALATGAVSRSGTVDAPIGRHPVHRTRMAVSEGGREAVTHYQPLEHFDGATLVLCRLETGRTHQIRVHMAHLGHALVGDATYLKRRTGKPLLDSFPRQALHAWQLALNHPVSGEAMRWQADAPADFAGLLRQLRTGAGR